MVSLRSIPDVFLVEVVREDPRICVVLDPRLGTVGVVVLFQLVLAVVARLIEAPAYEDRAPVAVEVLSVAFPVHDPCLSPAGVLGVARVVCVHSQLLARPQKSVLSRLVEVGSLGRVVLVALLRESGGKSLLHRRLIAAVLQSGGQLLVVRRALVLVGISLAVIGMRRERKHRRRENRRGCQRAEHSFKFHIFSPSVFSDKTILPRERRSRKEKK